MTQFPYRLFLSLSIFLSVQVYSQEGTFDSDGIPIHYTDQGMGESVVLVHGFSQNLDAWHYSGIVEELSDTYRVITMDLRGHGMSGKPHEPEAYGRNLGDDIVRLLDYLDLGAAHLVGYSMGAGVVGAMLVRNPDRVLTATLAGGYFPHWDESEEEFAEYTEERGRLGERFPWEPENQDFLALAAAIRGAKFVEVSDEEIAAVSVPTLVVFGSEELDHVQVSERHFVTTPTVNLSSLIVEGANHDNLVLQPEFLQAVLAHINGVAMTNGTKASCIRLGEGQQFGTDLFEKARRVFEHIEELGIALEDREVYMIVGMAYATSQIEGGQEGVPVDLCFRSDQQGNVEFRVLSVAGAPLTEWRNTTMFEVP